MMRLLKYFCDFSSIRDDDLRPKELNLVVDLSSTRTQTINKLWGRRVGGCVAYTKTLAEDIEHETMINVIEY